MKRHNLNIGIFYQIDLFIQNGKIFGGAHYNSLVSKVSEETFSCVFRIIDKVSYMESIACVRALHLRSFRLEGGLIITRTKQLQEEHKDVNDVRVQRDGTKNIFLRRNLVLMVTTHNHLCINNQVYREK